MRHQVAPRPVYKNNNFFLYFTKCLFLASGLGLTLGLRLVAGLVLGSNGDIPIRKLQYQVQMQCTQEGDTTRKSVRNQGNSQLIYSKFPKTKPDVFKEAKAKERMVSTSGKLRHSSAAHAHWCFDMTHLQCLPVPRLINGQLLLDFDSFTGKTRAL